MMETMTKTADLMKSPWDHFETPEELLATASLDDREKRRALESWKLDAELRMTATSENMTGGAENELRAVAKCLEQLS